MRPIRFSSLFLVSLLVYTSFSPARAATFYWLGGIDNQWFGCASTGPGPQSESNWSYTNGGPQIQCACFCISTPGPDYPDAPDTVYLNGQYVELPKPGATIGTFHIEGGTLDLKATTQGNAVLTILQGWTNTGTLNMLTTGGYRPKLVVGGSGLVNEGSISAGAYGTWEPQISGNVLNFGIIDITSRLTFLGPTFDQMESGSVVGYITGPGRLFVAAGATFNYYEGNIGDHVSLEGGTLYVAQDAPAATFRVNNAAGYLTNNFSEGATLVVGSGGTLNVIGGGENRGTIRMEGGSVFGQSGSFFNSSASEIIVLAPGTLGDVANEGPINLTGSDLTIAGPNRTVHHRLGDITGDYTIWLDSGTFRYSGGHIYVTPRFNGGTLLVDQLTPPVNFLLNRAAGGRLLDNQSQQVTITVQSPSNGDRTLTVADGASNHGTIVLEGLGNWDSKLFVENAGLFTNASQGTIRLVNNIDGMINGRFSNYGTIEVPIGWIWINTELTTLTPQGLLEFGTYDVTGQLRIANAPIVSNGANIYLRSPTAKLAYLSGTNALTGLTMNTIGGRLELSGGNDLTISAATFTNEGTVVLAPGSNLTAQQSFAQSSTGIVHIKLSGPTQTTDYGQIVVGGPGTLGGSLRIELTNGFQPATNHAFRVVSGTSVSGTFASVDLPPVGTGQAWKTQYDSLGVLLSIEADSDADTIGDSADICPLVANPLQADIDLDGLGDLCDACPGDSSDGCIVSGSAALEVSAADGGTLSTPDASVTIEFQPGDLSSDLTISATQRVIDKPNVQIQTVNAIGMGMAVSAYQFEPSGVSFNSSVATTILSDVSSLSPGQRAAIGLFVLSVPDGRFVQVEASCSVVEQQATIFTAECSAELEHFSEYALIAADELVAVPAVSTWGCAILTLLIVTAGTFVLRTRGSVPGSADGIRAEA